MLRECEPIAFVPTSEPVAARAFYEQTLALDFVSDDPFALVFNARSVMLRVVKLSPEQDFRPAPFTILGCRIPDARAAVLQLRDRGVRFERYAGMNQDDLGIWQSPGGAKVAWFKDPDGNVLSITEM